MKVLFITNIPAPYRVDFYNKLGKYVELTVIFEAKSAEGINFNWNIDEIRNFKAIFLSEGDIQERKINWNILKYINKNYYDHIVATNYSYFTEMIALIYLKLKRIPYYLETDGGLIREESSIKRMYKKFLISNAKGYFSPSKSSDEYLKFYGADKNAIYRYPFTSLNEEDILNEVTSIEEKIKIKNELGIKEQKVILSVGQFIHRKGFDILLKASKGLNENIGVIIIGGEVTNEYLDLKEEMELKNVYFEGFKTKDELQKYYKAADLFVLPTREDIWGLVINEAIAYGLPVITTDKCIAGLELINNDINGQIVEVDNYKMLNIKLNEIINDNNKLILMSKNSINKSKKYTIEEMVKKHLDIFNKK